MIDMSSSSAPATTAVGVDASGIELPGIEELAAEAGRWGPGGGLAGRLPAGGGARSAGRLDSPRAGVLAEETQDLPHHLAELVEAQVLDRASRQTPGRLRECVRRRVLAVDADAV